MNRGTSLNPNAAEFIPFSLRASSSSSGKQLLNRSDSNTSEDEVRLFWQHQLPDDITPDFKDQSSLSQTTSLSPHSHSHSHSDFKGQITSLSPHSHSHSHSHSLFKDQTTSLSPHSHSHFKDQTTSLSPHSHFNSQTTTLSPHSDFNPQSTTLSPISPHSDFNPQSSLSLSLAPLSLHSTSSPPSTTPTPFSSTSYIRKSINLPPAPSTDHHHTYFDSPHPTDSNPLHFLALQFPGFASESLAEVYYANTCDLHLTIEMLTQLELQVDAAFDQPINSNTLSAPNLTSMDFPALPLPDNKTNPPKFTADQLHQSVNPYRSSDKDNMFLFKTGSSLSSKGASDFASAVRKLATHDSGLWKYDRNSSADAIVGSSKTSHVLSGSYDIATGRSAYIDRMQSRSSSRVAPIWLETGDAVANLYSELREEARDHARIRNTYLEQARQAYLIGNKALAKELSVKGQVHNMQMKAAHNKAQESIYRQRNPTSQEGQGVGRSNEKMIDLHGLHVSEAIHVLRHELGILRNAARMGEQCLQVYICVGTGHHTRGSRTPARLPISVQHYLIEEGLDYTEPQPGLLRVVLY